MLSSPITSEISEVETLSKIEIPIPYEIASIYTVHNQSLPSSKKAIGKEPAATRHVAMSKGVILEAKYLVILA